MDSVFTNLIRICRSFTFRFLVIHELGEPKVLQACLVKENAPLGYAVRSVEMADESVIS